MRGKINKESEVEEASIKKPSIFYLLTEVGRAMLEFGTFLPYRFYKNKNQSGDGHPVIVFPGFMGSDKSTLPLRNFLDNSGYNAYGWDEGRNYGNPEIIENLCDLVEYLYRSHQKKVSLIGWSLGGVFARQVAKELPHITKQVITLGSPFGGLDKPNNAIWLYKILTHGKETSALDPDYLKELAKPTSVPTTAVYSKQDGVVPWQVCLESIESDIHQNIQVVGSHFGLGHNPAVLEIILNRLQFDQENWSKWEAPQKLPSSILYPIEQQLCDISPAI